MTCPICQRWAPPDAETGYDADESCGPVCAALLEEREGMDDAMQELPADLLRNAATLIVRAVGQLDTRWHTCAGCGAKRFTLIAHGHAYERLAELSAKLRTIADRLDADVAVHEDEVGD